MAAPMKVNRKRKAVGKNKKKGWKQIDISELEDVLEDERLQERTGGLVADKPDDKLFFVDKTVEHDAEETSEEAAKKPLRKSQRKNRPLRCFANLEPDAKIKPARIQHNIRKRPRVSNELVNRLASKQYTVKELTALKQRQQARRDKTEHRKIKKWNQEVDFDLWGDQTPAEGDDHYRLVTKKRRVKVPSHYNQKPSRLPAVALPHPGMSYNPSYEDHQDLLWKAHDVEVTKEKSLRKIFNALDGKFPTAAEAPTQETWLEEMSAGLNDTAREEEVGVPTDDLDKISTNPPVRREDAKTKKQRRKDRERRNEAKRLAGLRAAKSRKNELNRLKSLKKEIRQEEQQQEEKATRKAELREKYRDKPKKLGKLKYVEPDLDLKLGEELVGSLRLLKPEGHLLRDHFHSLQKRNIIETRERAKKSKKRKRKVFERKSHREVTL